METPSSPKSKLKCWHPPNTTVHAKSLQSCLTLCNPMDYNPPIICPWDSLGKNNGVGCHALLQGIFLTQVLNLHLLHCRRILDHWATWKAPCGTVLLFYIIYHRGLPWWHSGKESTCQCRIHRSDPWFRNTPRRRKWQPAPVFLPGKSHGQRSLGGGNSPWGRKESNMTEHTHTHLS